MRFLCLYKGNKPEGTAPTPEAMAEMGRFIETSMKAGVLLATEGCLPSAAGSRVRLSEGKVTVIDGPFAESKEPIGGFAIIQVESKQRAIEYTKGFLQIVGGGESEIRQLYEKPASADKNR